MKLRTTWLVALACGSAWGCQQAAAEGPAAASAEPAAASPPAVRPPWYVTGSDPRSGEITVRCENEFPPEGSGVCTCQGAVLDPCVARAAPVSIDRKQCGFRCAPSDADPAEVALVCPGGGTPRAGRDGCLCEGKPMNPCIGGKATAVRTRGDQCYVRCAPAAG